MVDVHGVRMDRYWITRINKKTEKKQKLQGNLSRCRCLVEFTANSHVSTE
jgi:hypothetical protein